MRRLISAVTLAWCLGIASLPTQARDLAARAEFQRLHPCPANNERRGSCPGYVVDHVKPLACGGADAADNMQWQTVAAGHAKDRVELYCDTPAHQAAVEATIAKHGLTGQAAADVRRWNDPNFKPPMAPRRREKGPILPANPAAFYQWGYHWYGYPYRPRPRLILHPTPGWGSAR